MDTIPDMVRILPMDRAFEFNDLPIQEVQEFFFLQELPQRKDEFGSGKFLYKSLGMNAVNGAIFLFQYDSKIIALAELTHFRKFEKPQQGVDTLDGHEGDEEYKGAYYFDPLSIKVFDPVDDDEIKSIWGEGYIDPDGKERKGFKRFSQSKVFLNPEQFPKFFQKLQNVRSPAL
jgi:hypothetical protein